MFLNAKLFVNWREEAVMKVRKLKIQTQRIGEIERR